MNKLDDFISKRSGSTCRKYPASRIMHCVILTAFLFVSSSCSKDDSFYREEGNIIGHYYGFYEDKRIYGLFIETGDGAQYVSFNLTHDEVLVKIEELTYVDEGRSVSTPVVPVNFQYRVPLKHEIVDIEQLSESFLCLYPPLNREWIKAHKQIYITQIKKIE